MIKVIISGIEGRMGSLIRKRIDNEKDITCVGGVEKKSSYSSIPIVTNLEEIIGSGDMVVDFSNPEATLEKLPICRKYKKGMVIGTTGFSEEEKDRFVEAGKIIPIVLSPNMSIGVNLLYKLVEVATHVLKDKVDIEIIEKHHKLKKDAPSGTAVALGEVISKVLKKDLLELSKYGRYGKDTQRGNEIGFHSVRGGSIVGEHEILFIGENEIIEITHKANSREVFVDGAITAIKFLATKQNGFYQMKDVLGF
jgi:4-hydroxy-tetrahydrodipicolinate reductase